MQKIKSNIIVESKRKQKRKEREDQTPRKQAADTVRPRWIAHLFPGLIWGRPPGSPGSQRELRGESWLHQTTFPNVILEDTALGLSLEILQVSVSRTTMKRNTQHPERNHLARTQREACDSHVEELPVSQHLLMETKRDGVCLIQHENACWMGGGPVL